jgi:rhodanese-related sulfurtransferase
MLQRYFGATIGLFLTAGVGLAQDTATNAGFVIQGPTQNVTQSATADVARLTALSRKADSCAAICIAPLSVHKTVATVAEAEVFEFIANRVATGTGLLIDGRAIADRDTGAIINSISVPSALVDESNPFRDDILVAMGARSFDGVFNFSDAMPVMVYDQGPLADDAGALIRSLLQAGYPAEKIQYYRGGLQVWTALGLSVEETAS